MNWNIGDIYKTFRTLLACKVLNQSKVYTGFYLLRVQGAILSYRQELKQRRPHIITFGRGKQECLINVPAEGNAMKEREKIDKYGGLRSVIAMIWQLR